MILSVVIAMLGYLDYCFGAYLAIIDTAVSRGACRQWGDYGYFKEVVNNV